MEPAQEKDRAAGDQSTAGKLQPEGKEAAQAKQAEGKVPATSQTELNRVEPETIQADVNNSKGVELRQREHPHAVGEQGKQTKQTAGNQVEAKDKEATQVDASQLEKTDVSQSQQVEKPTEELDEEEIWAQQQLLKDIEDQCVSHGRHPGEWDNLKLQWVDEWATATPYFCVSERLMKPLRPREVLCELLASGIPVSPTAHISLKTVPECKEFVKAAKKLIAHVRSRMPLFSFHVAVATDRGLLSNACAAYIKEARDAVHGVNIALAAGALKAVEDAHPEVAGTIQLDAVERWLDAMSKPDYQSAVFTKGKAAKAAAKSGAAKGGPDMAVVKSNSVGCIADKVAQFLSNLYHLEVKAAKARREKGEPPQSLLAPANNTQTNLENGGGKSRAAPGTSSSVAGKVCKAPPNAAQAMLAVLQMLPSESKLGYKTADGFFVPLNLNNLQVEHGAAERVVPTSSVDLQPGKQSSTEDSELKELHAVYQPVLWMPGKQETLEQAWKLHVEALGDPEKERTDQEVKKAQSEKGGAAVQKLRQDHYADESVRKLLREVALLVMQRVTDGLLVPVGSPKKTLSKLEQKLSSLELPALEPGHPPPATVLLEQARAALTSSNKRELKDVGVKGKDTDTETAADTKKPRVAAP